MSQSESPQLQEIKEAPLLHVIVAEKIAEAIVRGDFFPGERMSEVVLAEQLGVSRSPVREALRQLRNDGLLVYESRKGMSVASIDRKEAIDFYEYRTLLQCECIRQATLCLSSSAIQELSSTIEEMKVACDSEHLHEYLHLVSRFYEVIEEACPNEVLAENVRSLSFKSMRFRSVSIRIPGRMDRSLNNHQELFIALSAKDQNAAVVIATMILEDSLNAILQSLPDTENF
jgi:DNA-binding GntR family transcriptional regulator